MLTLTSQFCSVCVYEIKIRELSEVKCKTEYEENLIQKWDRVRGQVIGGGGGGVEQLQEGNCKGGRESVWDKENQGKNEVNELL